MNISIRLVLITALFMLTACSHAKPKNNYIMDNHQENLETATLGGGCFWCIEAVFIRLKGIESSMSGFSGGNVKNPAYREVITGRTGHAEVIQLKFDPRIISYREILEIFFHLHDPTTLNRQGADIGTQYRSIIFYHDENQERIAREVFAEIDSLKIWPNPLVTEIKPFTAFYKAEDYHQDYYSNNPNQPYCTYVINPKVKKLNELYNEKLKTKN
jgi:peptide-methionine (S)-S-oxide reductase